MENNKELNFFHEIRERLKMPWNPFNWAFFGYLIFILIGVGGLGIWANTYRVLQSPFDDGQNVAVAIATFATTLLARSYLDLNLLINTTNRISMQIYSVVFLILGIVLFWLTNIILTDIAFIPALITFTISILIWVIANADSEKFDEKSYSEKIRNEANKKHGSNWATNSNAN